MFADIARYSQFRGRMSNCALDQSVTQELDMDFSDEIEENLTRSGMNNGYR
jgi:hypothetical protein